MNSFEIIDFHTHPFGFGAENICPHAEHCDMSVENIVRDLKAVGVSKICGSAIIRADKAHSGLEAMLLSNRAALELSKKLGGFYIPGIMVHPDHIDESIAEIDKYYAEGVRIIGELVPYMQGWSDYSRADFSRLLDYITEKNMLVSLHSMGEDEMDQMVERHPDTKFIFAHPGEYGEFMRHINRMKKSQNCLLDLSGYGMFRHGMLRRAIDELGIDRIIFGSDYPTCNPAMYVGGVLLDPMLTDYEKTAIFSGNIKRLLASVEIEL